jgi:hypothetical protein
MEMICVVCNFYCKALAMAAVMEVVAFAEVLVDLLHIHAPFVVQLVSIGLLLLITGACLIGMKLVCFA